MVQEELTILNEDINAAIQNRIDTIELATIIYPRLQTALVHAEKPGDVNEIRNQIETVKTYIRRTIPKEIEKRKEQFQITHEGDMLYLKASSKAGALWKVCENRRPHGGDRGGNQYATWQDENSQLAISALDAGFKNPRDAVSCERISELDEEEWRTYEIETLTNMRQATMNGLENVWRMLNHEDLASLPSDKYRVIYADPPWKYGNTQPESHGVQDDHYPLLNIKEICNLPVKDIAEDNSVLFLWVTSPILEESFQVIKAWGFKYKASFVWDKVKHNMGHYNSVRHEFLLICTRGSCTPDVLKLFDSVITIERSDHSRKPEQFREIIDTIYPFGKRIELFARDTADGWDTYGNEFIS